MTPVRLEPAAPRSGVKHSTTEPLCSLLGGNVLGNRLNNISADVIFVFGVAEN